MKKKTLEAVFRNKRHDLWVKRDLMIEPLKKINFDLLQLGVLVIVNIIWMYYRQKNEDLI